MNKENENNDNKKRRIIEIIVAIIIIILLLITSCTAKHFGHLGKKTKESHTKISDKDKMDIIRNKNLIFDVDDIKNVITIDMSYGDYKLSFSTKGIKPKKYSCTTSDSSIATCVVEDGFVRVKPKKKGKVTIELSTKTNGKKYITQVKAKVVGNKNNNTTNNNNGTNKNNKNTNTNKNGNNGDTGSTSGKDDTKVKNSDATLKSLTLSGYLLTPNFDSNTTNYSITVPNSVKKLNINAIPNAKTSKVKIIGNNNFRVGNNTVTIRVTAEDGTTKDYKITVTREQGTPLSSNAYLSNITFSNGTLNEVFNKDTYDYTVSVDKNTTSLQNLVATKEDNKARVEITGNSNFRTGNNTVKIKVTAEDGTTIKEYRIVVNKAANDDSSLNDLKVRYGGSNHTMDQVFNKNNTDYTITVPSNVTSVDMIYTKSDNNQQVVVTGNTNLTVGNNTVKVKVTAEDGTTTTTYNVVVTREEDLSQYYLNTLSNYTVGYRDSSSDNYKNIIINSNILDGNITSSISGNKLTITNGTSTIEIESSSLTLEYLPDSSSTGSYVVKVSYNSTGNKTLTVTGKRNGTQINQVNVTFDVKNLFEVAINAKENGGFFNEFADIYNLTFYAGEELDLATYNEAYKIADQENCKSFKFLGYDANKNATTPTYQATYNESTKKYTMTDKVAVNSDLVLYAIFSSTDESVEYKTKSRIYLTDVDIFVVDGGINKLDNGEYLIYPGAEGAYVMTLENTTNSILTLKEMEIEENEICAEAGVCLNMGYVVKYNGTTDVYLLGSATSFHTLTADSHDKKIDLTSHSIVMNPGDSVEISLIWKWVHDDVNDTKIGKYVHDSGNNRYEITVSYLYDKTDTRCQIS